MQWQQIHHVAIIVSDYRKAKEFYVEKLGFPILRENYRPARGDWKLDLRVGTGPDAVELEIFNREEKEIPSSTIGEIVMDELKKFLQ